MLISVPYSPKCMPFLANIDESGIFEFKMPLLNNSIPYAIRIEAARQGSYESLSLDQFVGGYPITDTVELGNFIIFQ